MPSIAVVGASKDRSKFGNKAVRSYLKMGWTVLPVHPKAAEIEGVKAVASLADVQGPVERVLFYQALNVVLEVMLDDELELADYEANFRRMFGDARMDAVIGSVEGSVRFHGLTPTSMKLEGLDRHQRLIDSYRKLHEARARAAGVSA